jgi:hypothetical protein
MVAALFAAETGADETSRPLPAGVYAIDSVRPLMADMWQRSPSFRAQLDRIVDAQVRIVVEAVSPIELGSNEARSKIVREGGAVRYVRIQVRAAADWTALIPHELEHVLEAIEGLDLRKLADRQGDVWRTGPSSYESARAQQAGLRIAREFKHNGPPLTARLERQ